MVRRLKHPVYIYSGTGKVIKWPSLYMGVFSVLCRSVQQGAGASTAPGMSSEQPQDPNPSMASFNTPPRGPMPTEMSMQSANKHDFREPFQDYSSVLTGKFI